MKKTILLSVLALLLTNCSSEDSPVNQINAAPVPTFAVAVSNSGTTINVDQEFTITITAQENMSSILYSFDNFVTERGLYSNLGLSQSLKFRFKSLGNTTIYVKAGNSNNISSTVTAIPITITRGNAVKITGLQIINFTGINTTWDPEFPVSNPNHLADVFFGIQKQGVQNTFTGGTTFSDWYKSTVKQNQGDLTWDLTAQNLYIEANKNIRFGLADSDDVNVGQDLTGNVAAYIDFNLDAYIVTRPAQITFTYPALSLEFKLNVEWPN